MYNCPSPYKVKETRKTLTGSEKELYRVWLEETFEKSHLETESGEDVSIISTGKRNELEGPDFYECMVVVGDDLRKGEVEIHVENKDWYKHGHEQDAKYNDVVLHVVSANNSGKEIRTEDGNIIPTLVLDDYVVEPIKTRTCSGWNKVDNGAVTEILDDYGHQRFNKKALLLKTEMEKHCPENVIYKGLLDVLGYSKNREPFKKLARILPYQKVVQDVSEFPAQKRIPVMEALYLGTGGFLEPEYEEYLNSGEYLKGIQDFWKKLKNGYNYEKADQIEWHFVKSRPANHPTVRIIGLVQIIENFYPNSIEKKWRQFVSRSNEVEKLYEWGSKYFQEPGGLWQNHPLLHRQNRNKILGDKRLMDLLSNYLLPFAKAYGVEKNEELLVQNAVTLSRKIKRGAMPGIIKKMFNRLGISTQIIDNNNVLQGSIEFYKSWCKMNLCKLCPMGNYAE